MTQPSAPTLASWAMIVTLGLVWGATFIGVALALEGFSPLWVAAGRLTLAAALMLAIVQVVPNRVETDGRARWPYMLFIGAMGAALPFFLLSWGQVRVASGFAGVSMAMIALLVLPLSHLFVPGETMTLRKTIGVLLGVGGVAALFWGRFDGGADGLAEVWGQAACLCAAACYATASIATRLCPPIEPIRLAAAQLTVGAAIVLPIALIREGLPAIETSTALTALVVLALIPTAGANLLRVLVIRSAGPQFMSLTNFQVPVWAVIFGALVLGEPVPPQLALALLLILGGITVTQWPTLRRLIRRKT
ncbi:DMT family transporter [Aestuariibius sp. 2305UL40-4]|uniref:DMT family transporter n=1 Tax=Aestuariibius violaceus TaxID=3234132 RepID=UPI00345E441A